MNRQFKPADLVIYRRTKHSPHPGPRATGIQPAPRGETYTYSVDKFWVVTEVGSDGKLLVRTRRGKQYELEPDDPALRKARWWERLLYRGRFPSLET